MRFKVEVYVEVDETEFPELTSSEIKKIVREEANSDLVKQEIVDFSYKKLMDKNDEREEYEDELNELIKRKV